MRVSAQASPTDRARPSPRAKLQWALSSPVASKRRRIWLGLVTLLSLAACRVARAPDASQAPEASTDPAAREISLELRLGRLDDPAELDVCSPRELGTLELPDPDGASAVLQARGERDEPLEIRDDEIVAGQHRCAHLKIALGRLPATRVVDGGDGRRALMIDSDQVLWHPQDAEDVRGTMRVSSPAGLRLAAPWQESGADEEATIYSLDPTAFRWAGFLAVGEMDLLDYSVAGTRVRVAKLPGKIGLTDDELRAWLSESTQASASLLEGRAPYPNLTVLLVPVRASDSSVQFGMLRRGGGPSVMLLLSATATPSSLSGHWVAIHEQLHQIMPLLESDDAWLSEGFATYYTEIVRARLSLQPPVNEGLDVSSGLPEQSERALARLAAGFGRGQRSVPRETLVAASQNLHEWAAYQRVYWQGAALLMELDLELRSRSAGAFSLDTALVQMSPGMDRGRRWSAQEWMRRLQVEVDRAGLGTFRVEPWFDSRLEQRGMTSLPAIASALGLDERALLDGKLVLDPARAKAPEAVALRVGLFGAVPVTPR